MIESEKREGEITNKVEKEQPRKKCPKASEASFWTCFRGFSFSTLLVISLSLCSGLTFPLFHGSSFPSLFFIPFFPLFHGPSFASLLFIPFFPLFHGSSFSSLLFISFFPLFHGSSFPSLLFKPFFYDLQPLPSRPCPWHIMWNDA